MKKIIKIWSLYLIAWVFIFGQPEEDVFAESTAMLNSMEYETEDYVVRTIVEEKWENKQKLTVIIENVGETIIDNWSVSFDMSAEIVDIWNAKVCAKVGDIYVLKNVEYNQDILVGESISFGCIIETEDDFILPQEYLILWKETELAKRIEEGDEAAKKIFLDTMDDIAKSYNTLADALKSRYVSEGMAEKAAEKKAIEDARYVLPNACTTKMIVTMNARSLHNFFKLRCCNRAQWEIRDLACKMLALVKEVAPNVFKDAGPACVRGGCSEGNMTCGKAKEVRERSQTL